MVTYPTDDGDQIEGDPLLIPCYYMDGMEGVRSTYYSERVAIRLRTVSPFFSEVYPGVHPFTLPTLANAGQVMYRNAVGAWRSITPNSTQFEQFNNGPVDFRAVQMIFALGFLGETLVIGGRFTDLEGNTNLDYLVANDTDDDSKTILGDGVNGDVFALARGKLTGNKQLAAMGEFAANRSGARTARRLAVHPGGPVSTPLIFPAVGFAAGSPNAFAFHPNGRVYVCGDFTQLSNGTSVPSGLAYLDATTYNAGALNFAAGTALSNGFWNAAVVGPDELVYFGGMDGAILNGIAAGPVLSYHPPTGTIRRLGERLLGQNVYGLSIGRDGYLYAAGGYFGNSNPGVEQKFLARYNGFEWDVLPPSAGGTPGGFGAQEVVGARGVENVDGVLHIVGGFARPSPTYARFISGRMARGDLTLPYYGVGSIGASDGGALAIGLMAGHPTQGGNPWVKPSPMTAYPPAVASVICEEESDWELHVVGPCVLDSFSNFTTNANIFFAPLTVIAGDYVRITSINGHLRIRGSRGEIMLGSALAYADIPSRMTLLAGENNLQVALHNYTSATRVSVVLRTRVRSFDYAD